MGVNSLPKTVTRQRRDCYLNPGPSAPESSTLTTRLRSYSVGVAICLGILFCICVGHIRCGECGVRGGLGLYLLIKQLRLTVLECD